MLHRRCRHTHDLDACPDPVLPDFFHCRHQFFCSNFIVFFGQIKSVIWQDNAFASGFNHLAFGVARPTSHADTAHRDTPTAFASWVCDIFAFFRSRAIRLFTACIRSTSLYDNNTAIIILNQFYCRVNIVANKIVVY